MTTSDSAQIANGYQPSDEELLNQLASGQTDVLQTLHRRYAPLIFNLAAQSLDRPAAEEIVQDVFLALWRKADTFDAARGSARPWILRIAHHRVLNELRRRSRRPSVLPDPDGLRLQELPDKGVPPDEALWRDYRRAALQDAVEQLPGPQRQALSLAYFEELSQQQIADYLQVPLGTVKTRIRTGMQRLRVSLLPVLLLVVALLGAIVAGLALHQRRQSSDLALDGQALRVVTSSDIVPLRLTSAPGVSSDTHATFRSHETDDLAVMTFSHFTPAPSGRVYQIWIERNGQWESLGTMQPNGSGSALLVITGHQLHIPPDALKVTLEPRGGSQMPTGPTVVSWTRS